MYFSQRHFSSFIWDHTTLENKMNICNVSCVVSVKRTCPPSKRKCLLNWQEIATNITAYNIRVNKYV